MAKPKLERAYPDKGWDARGWYRCLGFGCGWGGWPFAGTACPVCQTVVPDKTMTQERWRREIYAAGHYHPTPEPAASAAR